MMSSYSLQRHSSRHRSPLGDATNWVNNQSDPFGSSFSSQLPHHESIKPGGNLQALKPLSSRLSELEDKRLSAVTDESQRNSNRDSQISTVSTNASGKSRHKTHVGPWRLGRTLGKGMSGRVRKARHDSTGQDAAIKIVSKHVARKLQSESLMNVGSAMERELAGDGESRMIPFGIEREVVIMKLIEHPHIISLYDVWENRGELFVHPCTHGLFYQGHKLTKHARYLVLEYVEGGELFYYICENGCLPEHEAVRIFRQILSGLSYCHRFNICHRDLKPENILIDRRRNVKIVDFGMAALQPVNRFLRTSCGSPHYAPPEIIMGLKYHGHKVDVWSCGVILYAMLTGSLPFDSDGDYGVVIDKVLAGRYTFPAGLSTLAMDLINSMLQYDPRDRISMDAMWKHPLLKRYQYLDNLNVNGNPYIGPPAALTAEDCGHPIRDRSKIDKELLRNLQSLWHGVPVEELIQRLMNDELVALPPI